METSEIVTEKKKIVKIKRNLLDPVAALAFAKGSSLTQLCMFITTFLITPINTNLAKTLPAVCQTSAD